VILSDYIYYGDLDIELIINCLVYDDHKSILMLSFSEFI